MQPARDLDVHDGGTDRIDGIDDGARIGIEQRLIAARVDCALARRPAAVGAGHAVAEPQVEGQTDKLWVRFDNWFSRLLPGLTRGEYWVLYLDADYRSALVGHPDRDYLWLLARTPQVAPAVRAKLLEVAREQGYATERLIWRTPDSRLAP